MVFGSESWSYAELDARVDRLARLLAARGAGPETVVALGLPRSLDMVAALFAVLRAGAAYLPLELDYPADRLAFMVEDTAPVVLVTDSATAALLPAHPPPSGWTTRRWSPSWPPCRPSRTGCRTTRTPPRT
nr:AMP-binding protein [Kitasatospora fiedleri]